MPRAITKRMPGWLTGAIFGIIAWVLAVLVALGFKSVESALPGWMSEFVDTIGSIFLVISAPLAVGGWLLIWGDNGPPYPILESVAFNCGFAISFYGLLGGLTGFLISRGWPWQLSFWRLFGLIAAILLALGAIPLICEQFD